MTPEPQTSPFDAYAADYQQALQKGLRLTGEDPSYYANGRLGWTARQLAQRGRHPRRVLDFGCGTGTAAPYLLSHFRSAQICGVDVSADSIAQAQRLHVSPRLRFCTASSLPAGEPFDLAYCNGVFHHIAPFDRAGAFRQVYDLLAPGGVFALWENNPWNPGTRLVMSRVEFDRDAIMLWPGATRRLLGECGFRVLRTAYLFFFPALLKRLRPLEPHLSRISFGGQYVILCERP